MTRLRYVALLLPALALTACGAEAAPPTGVAPSAGDGSPDMVQPDSGSDAGTTYTGTGTVLESPEHGPQLCLGGVAESYPPQCGGPDIAGWSWDDVEGAESANGTTWGSYTVVGTYDGVTFTLTQPVVAPQPDPGADPGGDDPFATPCKPPDGGWAAVDPTSATDSALQSALELAAAADGYAGAWVDGPNAGDRASDPTELILNVTTTGDVAALEADLRAVWGGALCVSPAPWTEAELLAILDAVTVEPGFLSGGPDVTTGTVRLQVILDDGLQARMDETYGEGVVIVESALRAVE